MAKRKTKLTIRIPPYQTPRNAWRKKIHRIASLEAERAEVSYCSTDKLQLKVCLYLKDGALFSHDLDNRIKDIMDALQGRAGGSKKIRTLSAIIPNDSQIFRIIIEKSLPPKQSKGYGHLILTKYGGKKV
jgi:Holliday junction resolvase RusA-like endonuclease